MADDITSMGFTSYRQDEDGNLYVPLKEVLAHLKSLPTADVRENVRGHWKGKPICGRSTVRCSVCDFCFVENAGRWAFCPHCGADMRGSNNV